MNATAKKHPRRGFSLMEVLIAMGIAGVGMCGMMTALPVIAFQVQKIRTQVSGQQLATIAENTVLLQDWADPKFPTGNTDLAWVIPANPPVQPDDEVSVAAPFLIDPWSSVDPFVFRPPSPALPVSVFGCSKVPSVVMIDTDGDGTPDTQADEFFFRPFFTDPTSLKISAASGAERPELTYVSLNNSIGPDRNDDYSWFYTVLPKVVNGAIPTSPDHYAVADINAYHVSVVVSRSRTFDDDATHRVYAVNSTKPGSRADVVEVDGDAAIGKYAAVIIPVTWADGSGDWYGSCLRWYKVLLAKGIGTPPTATRIVLQPIYGDVRNLPALLAFDLDNTTPPPTTPAGSFLITADSIIDVRSFSVP